MRDHCSKLCALFSVRWVEVGALQLGLSIPLRFVAQSRLLNRAIGIPGLTTGSITELLGTEALALLVKGYQCSSFTCLFSIVIGFKSG